MQSFTVLTSERPLFDISVFWSEIVDDVDLFFGFAQALLVSGESFQTASLLERWLPLEPFQLARTDNHKRQTLCLSCDNKTFRRSASELDVLDMGQSSFCRPRLLNDVRVSLVFPA